MISAQILADSINPLGNRITSWLLTYPRFIHGEVMTHRVFSRNAASSRAIPISRMIRAVISNPAAPEFWGANEKGMQSHTKLGACRTVLSKLLWHHSRWLGVAGAWLLSKLGVHKQIANRLLEPWSHMTLIVTCTNHENFFSLRAHKDAQPEFQVLAFRMLNEYLDSEPVKLGWGQVHNPFALVEPLPEGHCMMAGAGRAARLSYLTHDGKRDTFADIRLAERLLGAGHWSPFEHIATAKILHDRSNFDGDDLSGWEQYRQTFVGENRTHVNLWALFNDMPSWVSLRPQVEATQEAAR